MQVGEQPPTHTFPLPYPLSPHFAPPSSLHLPHFCFLVGPISKSSESGEWFESNRTYAAQSVKITHFVGALNGIYTTTASYRYDEHFGPTRPRSQFLLSQRHPPLYGWRPLVERWWTARLDSPCMAVSTLAGAAAASCWPHTHTHTSVRRSACAGLFAVRMLRQAIAAAGRWVVTVWLLFGA